MAVPKNKTSKCRSRRRQSINMALTTPNVIECSNCGNKILRHRVCSKCGFYRNNEIFKPDDMA